MPIARDCAGNLPFPFLLKQTTTKMKAIKKIKGAVILAMLVAVTAVSCKKDKTEDPSANGSATVTATNYGFDGSGNAAFKSTAAGIVQVGKVWTLAAIKDGTTQSITIVLSNVNGTGTYNLLQDNADGNGAIITKDYTKPGDATLSYTTDLASSTNVKGGGEVKITKLTDTEAEGTFYIVAHNSAGKDAFAEGGKFSGKLNKQ